MKWIELANQAWEWIVGAFALAFIRTKLGRFALRKLADYLAKPVYDWVVRKGYIKTVEAKAEKQEKELKDAKNPDDFRASVDNLP